MDSEAETVMQLRNELRDKEMKLTDIRLEALSSAHQLDQLREAMNRMQVSPGVWAEPKAVWGGSARRPLSARLGLHTVAALCFASFFLSLFSFFSKAARFLLFSCPPRYCPKMSLFQSIGGTMPLPLYNFQWLCYCLLQVYLFLRDS